MNSNKISIQVGCAVAGSGLLISLSALMSAQAVPAGTRSAGSLIFRRQCASCHGEKGEGTKRYQHPLAGTRSEGELTRFIAKTMPPGPRKCALPDAQKVASYIYDAFYSSLAQARNKPARIALSRLTVRQFRNAVADLIGSFRQPDPRDVKRGLRAEYFQAKNFDDDERLVKRVDPEVHFDFGTDVPAPGKFNAHQFSIRWQGGVLAPDSGDYEFVVRTEHACRLWVDDEKRPLIDAWVKSGNDNEYRGSISLLGGRVYPIRLEFSKSTQGVDDTDKQKGKPAPKASIALEWRRPKQAVEVVPQRCLVPDEVAPAFVTTTPFPPDDRSIGYERGTSVSKSWDEATTSAALETGSYVVSHLAELSGTADNAADREAKIHTFCRQFVERAFRRPLTDDLEEFYVTRQLTARPDTATAVKRVVILAMMSPRFLYREIGSGNPDAYDIASRLSFGLWDSLPDQVLLKAAAAGLLSTRDQVVQQAQRMAQDPRAWFKLRQFLLQWLKVDQVPDLAKDPKTYPGFDEASASDLRTSLELFLENSVWTDRSDFRELLLTDKMYLNGRLAKLYGASLPADAPFQPVSIETNERSGVLTQPYIMASFAYADNSSPIHRGVLLVRNLLGRTLRPPPAAFTPLPASMHPNLTIRERVTLQTKPAACISCHGMINPLGFTLERFDGIGRLRERENGQPIDCSGSYRSSTGQEVKFTGARDLGRYLVGSSEAHAAFVEKLFQHLVKQPVRAYGPRALNDLQRSFEANEFSIRKLMVEIMAETALKR